MHRRRLCRFRRSSATPVLKHKALIIGINYTDDREHDFRPLKGPNNDAKDVKKTLIGESQIVSLVRAPNVTTPRAL